MSGQKANESDEIKILEETWYKKFKEANPKTGAVIKKFVTGASKVLPTASFVIATTTGALTGDLNAAFAAGGLSTLGGSLAGNGIKNIRDARKVKSHKAFDEAWEKIKRREEIVTQREKDLQAKQQNQNNNSDMQEPVVVKQEKFSQEIPNGNQKVATAVSGIQEPVLTAISQQPIGSTNPNQAVRSYLDNFPELFDLDFSQQSSSPNIVNPNSIDYSPLANIDPNEQSSIFNPKIVNNINNNVMNPNSSNPFL